MTLFINGKTYEASELIAYVEKLEKENLYYRDIVETNSAEWEEQGQRVVSLEKENAELKEKLEIEQNSRGDWFGKAVTKDRQLNEAIEIIKKLYAVYYDPCVTESDLKYRDELFTEVKQFLNNGVEK